MTNEEVIALCDEVIKLREILRTLLSSAHERGRATYLVVTAKELKQARAALGEAS